MSSMLMPPNFLAALYECFPAIVVDRVMKDAQTNVRKRRQKFYVALGKLGPARRSPDLTTVATAELTRFLYDRRKLDSSWSILSDVPALSGTGSVSDMIKKVFDSNTTTLALSDTLDVLLISEEGSPEIRAFVLKN